jgi:peroxiredoxin family protein
MLGWLAIQVTRGTSNNLFQVATLVRAATALEARVDVLFRDAALELLRRDAINVPAWSSAYRKVLQPMQERIRDAGFEDMERYLRDCKEHGDHVRFWACEESLSERRLTPADFTRLLDGTRSLADFLAESREADATLSF